VPSTTLPLPMSDPPLVLASASPRRAELLRLAGFTFEVAPADVDETPREAELAEHYVRRLAEAKARAVAAQHPGAAVLGADTTVAVDGAILGKPADSADAVAMLHRLQGRAHDVLTGVAVVGPGWSASSVATTRVWMAPLTAEDIDGYVASGEPMDKAGAYAIQGLASRFVTRIEGSYPNVVGLPVHLVHELLAAYRHARPAEAAPPTGSAAV
jgi:septum formation protein